ncbi:MAG: hypothetical protein ACI9FB_004644 [Candidatus Azotimanducaceae bacterium]|jgi:hypothetical protein
MIDRIDAYKIEEIFLFSQKIQIRFENFFKKGKGISGSF